MRRLLLARLTSANTVVTTLHLCTPVNVHQGIRSRRMDEDVSVGAITRFRPPINFPLVAIMTLSVPVAPLQKIENNP